MPRPEKKRVVHTPPFFTEFKPIGIPGKLLKQTLLSLDEYEAFRLADYIGLSHVEGADETIIINLSERFVVETAVLAGYLGIPTILPSSTRTLIRLKAPSL